jgi:hypothetical protein
VLVGVSIGSSMNRKDLRGGDNKLAFKGGK